MNKLRHISMVLVFFAMPKFHLATFSSSPASYEDAKRRAVQPRSSLKTFDYSYGSNQYIKLYAGTKSIMRLNGVPSNIEVVQISKSNSGDSIAARVVGNPNKHVDGAGRGGNFVEFTIEMPEIKTPTVSIDKYPVFNLKSFSRETNEDKDSYKIVDKFTIQVEPIICIRKEPVCALVKISCPAYDPDCVPQEKAFTFDNVCEMNKVNSELIHEGVCQ